jgi:pyruvate formate lyase activating enzyme
VDCTRREFLGRCAWQSAAVAGGAWLLSSQAQAQGYDSKREVKHYEKLADKKIQCHVCPLHCTLKDAETCFCRTRTNHAGTLYNHAYASPCVINVDPIEKTPLLHFQPGIKTLAFGCAGCNLRCLYCQNWQIAQEQPVNTKNFKLTAEDAVEQLRQKDIPAVAFTYTEPVSYLEYAIEVAAAVHKAGKKAVMASGAFVEEVPLKEACAELDGMVLALKGFTEDFYLKVCGVKLAPVLKAIEVAKKSGKWLELTTLVIPTYNDDLKKIKEMVQWVVKNLGTDVPLHFGRFTPEYKMRRVPQTPVNTLEECRNIALAEGVKFAYISNVAPHDGNHTYCPKCKHVVIRRAGFRLLENNLKNGACPSCSTKIPGVWA